MGRSITFLVVAFAIVFGLFVLSSWFYPAGFLFAQAPAERTASAGTLCLLAFLTLLGIVSSFIYERAKSAQRGDQSILGNLSAVFSDFRLIAALFASPMIFNSVYLLVRQNPESLSDFLLAYQNGFFWQAVISGIGGRQKRAAK